MSKHGKKHHDDAADDVVGALIGAGVVDSRGVFTVDTQKAHEKLERFRLADPLGYVVELVQAAGLAGAQKVDVKVSPSDFVIAFDGRAFTAKDLKDLDSALLVKDSADHPARQQLALGVSAARALNPRHVIVESGKTRLTLSDEDGAVVDEEGAVDDGFVTRVTVQERFALGQFVEFFAGVFGLQKEERLLEARCAYARFAVVVNGRAVNGGVAADLGVDVVDEGVSGVVGFNKGVSAPAHVVLLRAGVVQEVVFFDTEELTKSWRVPPGFRGVVDVPQLQRDASFTRFVRDAELERVLRAVVLRCRGAAALVAPHVVDGDPDEAWARSTLLYVMRHLGVELVGSKARAVTGLRKLPLFREASGRALTLDEILHDAEKHKHVAVLDRLADTSVLEEPRVVVRVSDPEQREVIDRLGLSIVDMTDALAAAVARRQRRAQWRERKTPRTLPGDDWVARASFVIDDTSAGFAGGGEVGLRRHGPDTLSIIVLADGCHLTTLTVPFPVPGLTFVVDGPLTPTRDFDSVVRDEALGRLLLEAVHRIPLVLDHIDTLPDQRGRSALLALLAALVDGEVFVGVVCDAVGCKPPPVRYAVGAVSLDHRCATLPLLPLLNGQHIALRTLVDGSGDIGVVPIDTPTFTPSIEPVLRAGDVLRQVLRHLAPHRKLVSLNDEAAQAKRRAELRAQRSPSSLTLVHVDASVPVSGKVGDADVEGFVGWSPSGLRGTFTLALHVDGRRCCRVQLPAPISGLAATFNDDTRWLNARLEAQPPYDGYVDFAYRQLPRLLPLLKDPWPLALELAATLLPTPLHTRALQRIAQNLAPGEVGPAWAELLALGTTSSDGDVAAAMELVVEEGAVPTLDRIGAVLDRKGGPPVVEGDARGRLLGDVLRGTRHPIDALLEDFQLGALTVARLDGRSATVAQLVAQPVVRFLSSPQPPVEGFDDVVVLSGAAQGLLTRLRDTALEDAAPALAVVAARAAFAKKGAAKAEIESAVGVVAKVGVDGDGVRGEVALVDGAASDKPQADLVVLHQGRTLARLPVGRFLGVKLLAVIDADDVTPTPAFDGVVHDGKLTAIIERVRSARELLIEQLVDAVAAQKEHAAVDAAVAVRARLLERLHLSHTNPEAALSTKGIAGRIAALPWFRTLAGEVKTLRALDDEDRGAGLRILPVVPAAVVGPDDEFADVVVVARAAEREVLARLFTLKDVEKDVAAAQRLAQTLKSLPPLSFDIVDDALVAHEAAIGKGTTLRLALPRRVPGFGELVLRVGHRGLLVETLGSLSLLPAAGVLTGDGAVTRDMKSARVDDKMLQSVQREAGALWRKALDALDALDGVDDDAERALLRDWLRFGALRLSHIDVQAVPPWLVALRTRLFDARVFVVDDGAISLNTAIAEQPRALAGLLRSHGLARAVAATPPTPSTTITMTPTSPAPPPALSTTPQTTTTTPAPSEPPAPPPKDEAVLLERLRTTITVVRDRGEALTGDLELSRLIVEVGKGRTAVAIDKKRAAVVVDLGHPLARRAKDDGAALLLLTSLVVTRINERLLSVTDDDEQRFHRALIAHALTF